MLQSMYWSQSIRCWLISRKRISWRSMIYKKSRSVDITWEEPISGLNEIFCLFCCLYSGKWITLSHELLSFLRCTCDEVLKIVCLRFWVLVNCYLWTPLIIQHDLDIWNGVKWKNASITHEKLTITILCYKPVEIPHWLVIQPNNFFQCLS